ncbi:hypothetical protein ACVWWN_004987 [Mycobacterium sp. URHB0021]|jgi:hypothetical protein
MTARKTAIRTAEKSRVRQALQWRTRLSHRRRNLCTQPTVTVPHLFSTDRPTSIPSVNGLPRSPMEPAQCIVPGHHRGRVCLRRRSGGVGGNPRDRSRFRPRAVRAVPPRSSADLAGKREGGSDAHRRTAVSAHRFQAGEDRLATRGSSRILGVCVMTATFEIHPAIGLARPPWLIRMTISRNVTRDWMATSHCGARHVLGFPGDQAFTTLGRTARSYGRGPGRAIVHCRRIAPSVMSLWAGTHHGRDRGGTSDDPQESRWQGRRAELTLPCG